MKLSSQLTTPAVLSLLLSSISGALATSSTRRATTCNGHSELCDKSFGNVTFVGTHNSYAVGTSSLFVNQDWNITQQLNDGVRMLQSQAHNKSGTIELCHTSCSLLDGGSLKDYLTQLKTWMDSNTEDVVSLLIVNSDNIAPSVYADVFTSAGLDTMAYTPSSSALTASSWPTLGSLIDSGKRLVVFLSTSADFTSVPYLIDEFTNVWETAYDVTDTTFDCNVNRTNGDTSTQMYLINHFLDKLVAGVPAPDSSRANSTNAASGTGSLGVQVETCAVQHGRNPNFMLVDFYEYGNGSVFQVAADANGVTYNPTTAVAQPKSSTSSTSSSTVVTTNSGAMELRVLPTQFLGAATVVASVVVGALAFF
ncbi:PLC-like phosphodiesterase [Epithele typhae]|uniref:PLC-like phosphodiesterase n=1 Tax=Epithele typhae TaxID=378194 RepID=UPI00200874ED|nr:PLC-like phosphodiesterase [Epithele typhae]KAH9944272.1 PLC-like phosphodiesterase [Epithele typhae]